MTLSPALALPPALALLCATGLTAASAADLLVEPGSDERFSWSDYEAMKSLDLSGQTITVSGPWLDPEAGFFEHVLAYFEEATGATVRHVGSDSFEQQIVVDTTAGSPPNLAIIPQPGLAAELAARGALVPLGEDYAAWVRENYAAGDSWADLATFPGPDGEAQFYGLFYRVDLKSLVWYVPENFEDAGYETPETLAELKSLTQRIAEEGETPWCIGLGSGAATGWPGTDWVENMMLRTQPPEVYDAWTRHEIPFDDERVVAAIDEFGWFARNDDFVSGGGNAVASTDFRDSVKGLFTSPPACYLHSQASFIPSFFPEGAEIGDDVDFFYLPADDAADLGRPVLGGGTMIVMTEQSEGATALMEFLRTPLAHELWMAQPSFLTPHKGVNTEVYASDAARAMGDILLDATTFRFDASDLMPGAIGAGAFWTGIVDYVSGTVDAQEMAADVERAWQAVDR